MVRRDASTSFTDLPFEAIIPACKREMCNSVVRLLNKHLHAEYDRTYRVNCSHILIDALEVQLTVEEVNNILGNMPRVDSIEIKNLWDEQLCAFIIGHERREGLQILAMNNFKLSKGMPLNARLLTQALSQCVHLRRLALCQIGVNDLAPLAALTALTYLSLSFMLGIRDLGPLSACTAIRSLALCNQIRELDLGPVGTLAALTSFTLSGFSIVSHWPLTTLQPLSRLSNLVELKVFDHKLVNCHPIASCSKLQTLRFH